MIYFLFLISFLLIFAEYIYSMYKKDGVYSKNGTILNVINGVVLIFVSKQFILLYLSLFYFLTNPEPFNFTVTSFLISLILVDFTYYIFHFLHHKVSFLWRFHSIHHSDKHLNLSTAYRISWLEDIYIYLFFIPLLFLSINPISIIFSFYLLCTWQFFCHSSYLKFPNFMSYIFVTPQLHKTHHIQETGSQNSNFGGIFSFWDKIFNTLHKNNDSSNIFGIKNKTAENPLRMQITSLTNIYTKNF
jgi:sterol desaturase/sphingolipid hydroxylase (fatty acid hydroxylase superfamily)